MKTDKPLIPDDALDGLLYAARCDYVFLQPLIETPYQNNKLSDITDNSTVYCWSSFLNILFTYLEESNLKNITLISGGNDHNTNPNGTIIGWPQLKIDGIIPCPKNVKKWYSQNAEIASNLMIPMPLGIHPPHTGKSLKTYVGNYKRDKLLYLNFNHDTNPIQRIFLEKYISSVISDSTNKKSLSVEEYFIDLQTHIFSLCPPGNGKDTHRVWESIMFGCIPIVEKSNMNDYFSKFYPMLVVDKWTDINENLLLNSYKKLLQKSYNYDLLDVNNLFRYLDIPMSSNHKLLQNRYIDYRGSVFTRDTSKCFMHR